jgi:hypothetical protein
VAECDATVTQAVNRDFKLKAARRALLACAATVTPSAISAPATTYLLCWGSALTAASVTEQLRPWQLEMTVRVSGLRVGSGELACATGVAAALQVRPFRTMPPRLRSTAQRRLWRSSESEHCHCYRDQSRSWHGRVDHDAAHHSGSGRSIASSSALAQPETEPWLGRTASPGVVRRVGEVLRARVIMPLIS